MILKTQLKFEVEEFREFYRTQIQKGEVAFRKKRFTEIFKSFSLCFGGITLTVISSIDLNLVPVGITMFLFGSYYMYVWAKLRHTFIRTKKATEDELNTYLQEHKKTDLISISVDKEKIHYYENGIYVNATDWKYLSSIHCQDDHFYLIFDKLEQLFLIPRFAVEEIFYESLLSLARKNFKISI